MNASFRGGTSVIFLAALLALSACAPSRAAGREGRGLVLPYAVSAAAPSDAAFDCPAPPSPPVHDLIYNSLYKKSDPQRATIDKKAREAYLEETADTQRFENALLRMSNDYMRTGSKARARCVLQWLEKWASKGALLGTANAQGVAVRKWMLASLGSAYAQVRDAPGLNAGKKRKVERWLEKCAGAVMADYPLDADKSSRLNNHLYWAAWAVAITGIALDDRALYDWAMARARWVLGDQIEDDGSLPLEMARGRKALHYHIFAAAPLVMLAEAGAYNGDDLYSIRGGSLQRLVSLAVQGMQDPSYFEERSGERQLSAGGLADSHFGWMEAYARRFPDAAIEKQLSRRRPVFFRQTGGNMTFLYR